MSENKDFEGNDHVHLPLLVNGNTIKNGYGFFYCTEVSCKSSDSRDIRGASRVLQEQY